MQAELAALRDDLAPAWLQASAARGAAAVAAGQGRTHAAHATPIHASALLALPAAAPVERIPVAHPSTFSLALMTSPLPQQEPLSVEDTAERHVRPARRQAFVDLCRGSVGAYLERFGFRSNLLKAMYAVGAPGRLQAQERCCMGGWLRCATTAAAAAGTGAAVARCAGSAACCASAACCT